MTVKQTSTTVFPDARGTVPPLFSAKVKKQRVSDQSQCL